MRAALRILSIEDDPKDVELIQNLLETENIVSEVTRVDTQAALLAFLEQGGVDLILADYSLPLFDGISALKLAMKACPDVPFIFVSGTLGEEVAVEALKIGATDYVLKTRLSRLVPSVLRALREASERAEHKQASEKLRQSEAYLAEAQKLSRTGSFGWNVISGEIHWSRETFRIFEYEPTAKVTIELIIQRTHPEDRAAVRQLIDRVSREWTDFDFEHRLLMPDGSIKYIEIIGSPSEIEDRRCEFVGAVTDITERKQAEEALRRSEAYLAEAQRLTHTGSCAIDGKSRETLYWSEEMFRLFGFDPQQGLPMWEQWLQRIHPEDRDKVKLAGDRTFLEKIDCDVEFRIVKSDGTVNQIHAIGHPDLSPNGDLVQVVGTMVDISERRRAEEARDRLRQLEADLAHLNRVSTMGELTASLAHEIKQPIFAAATDAETCLRWLGRDKPDVTEAQEAALRLMKDVTRASEIINRNVSLFKKDVPQRELVGLNGIIQEMIALLRNEASRCSISIHTELMEGLPDIMADRVALQQVLMNLMLNAIESMKEMGTPGKLTITTRQDENRQLLVAVTDTGVGLPSGQAEQIFTAFFTSKLQGSGMGLPISRSIIESHGGRLWAAPNSELGATFQFTLPLESAASQSA